MIKMVIKQMIVNEICIVQLYLYLFLIQLYYVEKMFLILRIQIERSLVFVISSIFFEDWGMVVCLILQIGVGGEYGFVQLLLRVGGILKLNKVLLDIVINYFMYSMNRFFIEDIIS